MGLLKRRSQDYTAEGTPLTGHQQGYGGPTSGAAHTTGTTGLGHTTHSGPGHHGTGATGLGGTSAGTGTLGNNYHGVHPAPVAGAGQVHTGPAPLQGVTSGSVPSAKAAQKLEKKGKMESTMGNILHSSSLKQKSENHLAQADHMRMQASELTEAERLEHEAGMRRQRAVGLGADPIHSRGKTGHGPGHIA